MNDEQVVIAAFRAEGEAEIARRLLTTEGIPASISQRTDAFERRCADVFDDGYDVIVPAVEAERGIAFLRTLWRDDASTPEPAPPRCPACGSLDILRIPRFRLFLVAAPLLLLAGSYVGQPELFTALVAVLAIAIVVTPGRRCRECGERW